MTVAATFTTSTTELISCTMQLEPGWLAISHLASTVAQSRSQSEDVAGCFSMMHSAGDVMRYRLTSHLFNVMSLGDIPYFIVLYLGIYNTPLAVMTIQRLSCVILTPESRADQTGLERVGAEESHPLNQCTTTSHVNSDMLTPTQYQCCSRECF